MFHGWKCEIWQLQAKNNYAQIKVMKQNVLYNQQTIEPSEEELLLVIGVMQFSIIYKEQCLTDTFIYVNKNIKVAQEHIQTPSIYTSFT